MSEKFVLVPLFSRRVGRGEKGTVKEGPGPGTVKGPDTQGPEMVWVSRERAEQVGMIELGSRSRMSPRTTRAGLGRDGYGDYPQDDNDYGGYNARIKTEHDDREDRKPFANGGEDDEY